jgi:hypothetical protein
MMTTPPAGSAPPVDDDGRPEGPVEQAVEKRKQKQVAIAGLAIGLAGLLYVILKNRSAAATAAASGGYTYPVVPTSTSGSGVDLSGLQSSLNSVDSNLATLSEQITQGAVATSLGGVTTSSTGTGSTVATPATSSPSNPFAGLSLIPNSQAGSTFAATKGDTIYAGVGGQPVPVVIGGGGAGGLGQRLPAWSTLGPGTHLYVGPTQG